MAETLSGTLSLNLRVAHQDASDAPLVKTVNVGPSETNVMPTFGLIFGTGTVIDSSGYTPVNTEYFFKGTIAAGGTKSIDMIGGADLDTFNVALALTLLKCYVVWIDSPNGIKAVRVGPQGVSNANAMGFGGVTAAVYRTTYWYDAWAGIAAGLAVTAGTGDLFIVTNPGGADLTVGIYFAGKK